ncbi:MAG: NAD-dependent epimerase/dehydratase family protein [Firmicutes bacterium]|jgi:UDP-glucose 4-epimerase|nr:NAD-dependent epimerase/dehydratase family protein [Bacillota bacterium]
MYLITGGAGFIGSDIAKKLVGKGEKVRVLDNLSTGRRSNLEGYFGDLDFVRADINAPEIRKHFEDVKIVFHQAALSSVVRSMEAPEETEYNNVIGTINVLNCALEAGVEKVIMASSASVYGDAGDGPLSEALPAQPLSPYAFSKHACEYYCKYFSDVRGLETVILRYFNVFGPNQDPDSEYSGVITIFLQRMKAGLRPVVYGDGEQTRDFVYVEDVARANLLAASSGVGGGEKINIAGGRSVSLLELVEKMNVALGTELEPIFEDSREGDIRHSRADIKRARELIDYHPVVDFAEGLEKMVEATDRS